MKKLICIIIINLVVVNVINAQSTDRFIRIIGNSSYEFKADTYRVYYSISEILPNEYNKVEYKSLEKNIADLTQDFKNLGIKENQIFKNYNVKNPAYGNMKTENFYVDITDITVLSKVSSLKSNGLKLDAPKFLYKNIKSDVENSLTTQAINDSRRKANSIAKELNMKVGKILNIEDKSSGCCSDFGETNENSLLKKYAITITFELID